MYSYVALCMSACLPVQARVSSLQAALSRAEADAERLSGLLAAAEAAAAAAKGREDAARAAGREYVERARRAETLLEEGDAELAEVSCW
jgi:conjugal transfer/entry exclusion protein